MPLFLLQVLKPPKFIIHTIEQIMARFFWGTYGSDQRKIHWICWDKICSPTTEEGLGIKRFEDIVTDFTYKLWWRFRIQTSLWAQFLQAKYCRGLAPGEVIPSVYDSFQLKRMCKVKQAVHEQMFWVIGAGRISFWYNNWFGYQPLSHTLNMRVMGYYSVDFCGMISNGILRSCCRLSN